MDDAIRSRAFSSIILPVSTNAIIITTVSKYVCHSIPRGVQIVLPKNVLKTLKRKAIPVESATNVSIFAVRLHNCLYAPT